jgi:NADP-dependent aldehyde dehydrogenase
MLRAIADALDEAGPALIAVADAETALGTQRLQGELTRTCFQLRFFASVVDEGSYLEATIDREKETAMGPRPDLRRLLVPLGPVAVFGASNFPLAFSVPGGDTASALAVGCPVVVKAHESHPATSEMAARIMADAIARFGGPAGTLALVHGRSAGGLLVRHPIIRAVGFTGSVVSARALMSLMAERPDPIPFYGELGSINPLIITAHAAEERTEAIGRGVVQSVTLGAGQFCTKPGLAFVPRTHAGSQLVEVAARAFDQMPSAVLLNESIQRSFDTAMQARGREPGLRELAAGGAPEPGTVGVGGRLFEVDIEQLTTPMIEECFGPTAILVRYDDFDQLTGALANIPASLTATLHLGSAESADQRLVDLLEEKGSRIVVNGFPTGVAVSWAQTHGGGWPATNSIHSSVGATALRRFLRPVTWQDAPEALLPMELRDGDADVPRRIDGVLRLPEHRGPQPT